MSDKNTGGPAFPREDYQIMTAPGQSGMTLRDYFAAKAMQAMLTGYYCDADAHSWKDENIAKGAYSYADAMISERNK